MGNEGVDLQKRAERLLWVAEHLFAMVPQSVWREHGEYAFGMYEGDYHAEIVETELKEHRKALEGKG